jgi:hypothetical protein
MMPIPGQWERRNGSKSATRSHEFNQGTERVSNPDAAGVAPGRAAVGVATNPPARDSRDRVTWFKVSAGACALLGATLLMMWVQQGQGAPLCAASFEAPRRLQLSRAGDREHLAADRASATRTAHRYVASELDTAARQQRLSACEAQLVQAIATTHGVTLDQVRTSDESSH